MKRNKLNIKGFTLIELLVVIAIIGILASVVLISLNAARGKAKDVKVISDVKQVRTQLENDYSGAQYQDLLNGSSALFGGFDPNAVGSSTLNQLISDAQTQGGAISVVNNPTSGAVVGYAVYGQLTSSTTQFFCMDSSGNTEQQTINHSTATCQ